MAGSDLRTAPARTLDHHSVPFDPAKLLDSCDRDGALVVRGLFSPTEIGAARAEAEHLLLHPSRTWRSGVAP